MERAKLYSFKMVLSIKTFVWTPLTCFLIITITVFYSFWIHVILRCHLQIFSFRWHKILPIDIILIIFVGQSVIKAKPEVNWRETSWLAVIFSPRLSWLAAAQCCCRQTETGSSEKLTQFDLAAECCHQTAHRPENTINPSLGDMSHLPAPPMSAVPSSGFRLTKGKVMKLTVSIMLALYQECL